MQSKFIIISTFLLLFEQNSYSINNAIIQKIVANDTSRIEIQFKDTFGRKVTKGFIILINNKEDFQIEFAKNEKYRKYMLDKNGLILIERKKIETHFSEGKDAVSAIYFYKNKWQKFSIDLRKNTINIIKLKP